MNLIILSGRTTRDVETKELNGGKKVANFTLAVDRRTGDGKVTDFFECKAWGKTADVLAKYAPKGKLISVTGEMQTRAYEDREGNKRKAYEVSVEKVELLGGKPEADSSAEPPKKNYVMPEAHNEPIDAGKLPFEI